MESKNSPEKILKREQKITKRSTCSSRVTSETWQSSEKRRITEGEASIKQPRNDLKNKKQKQKGCKKIEQSRTGNWKGCPELIYVLKGKKKPTNTTPPTPPPQTTKHARCPLKTLRAVVGIEKKKSGSWGRKGGGVRNGTESKQENWGRGGMIRESKVNDK